MLFKSSNFILKRICGTNHSFPPVFWTLSVSLALLMCMLECDLKFKKHNN